MNGGQRGEQPGVLYFRHLANTGQQKREGEGSTLTSNFEADHLMW